MFNNKYIFKIEFLGILALIITLFSVVFVSASFGVASSGTENLYSGQSIDSAFILQNTRDNATDLVIEASILKGGEYFSFKEGTRFSVPKQGIVSVPIRVSIPENAKIGDNYELRALFKTVSEGGEGKGSGMVQFISNVEQTLKINVIPRTSEKPAETAEETGETGEAGFNATWLWIVVIAVAVAVFVWLIVKMGKKKAALEVI